MTNASFFRKAIVSDARKPAKNSTGSLYCVGGVIYSYGPHYPLAVFRDGDIYVNSTKYSNTTGRHRSRLIATLLFYGKPFKELPTVEIRKLV